MKNDIINSEDLLKFLDFYATHGYQINVQADHHPLNVYKKPLNAIGEKQMLNGLKMAVNDMVSDSFKYNSEDVKKIDNFFVENGVVSLTAMRRAFSTKYNKIIKSKKISNDGEYYLVKGVLDDGSLNLDIEEENILISLISNYENS